MLFLTLTLACQPPVEAPAEIDDLSKYLFANFDSNGEDGEDALPAGLATLEEYLLTLDMSSDTEDRAISLSHLTASDLDGAPVPDGVELSLQVGVAVSGQTSLSMSQEVDLIMEPNQVCIASDTTAWHQVTVLSGGDCFADGSCDLLETSNEFLIDSISDGWLDTYRNYRWVELEDGRMAVLSKEWMPEVAPATSGDSSWDQRYAVVAWIPTSEGSSETLRYYALYSSVTTTLGDDAYALLVTSALDEYYLNAQAYVAGEECDNDRDREYDRE